MTLIITLTPTQITIAWIAYLIIWIVLFVYARRWCRKREKEYQEKRKDKTVGFITHDDQPGRYVDIQYSEYPWCEMHRNSN